MRTNCLARLCFGIVLLGPVATGAQDAKPGQDERLVFQYKMKKEPYLIVRGKTGDWHSVRPDGKKVTFSEIERHPSQIQIQNKASKLFVRLEADFAYWRRPKDEAWTRWVKGGWLADKDIPVAAGAILAKTATSGSTPMPR